MKRRPTKMQRAMKRIDACPEARDWVRRRTLDQCWKAIRAGRGRLSWATWWMYRAHSNTYDRFKAECRDRGCLTNNNPFNLKIRLACLPEKAPRLSWWKDI